jgi:hypothetical protein
LASISSRLKQLNRAELLIGSLNALFTISAVGRPAIVRRSGEDLAAVVPLEHLELVREFLARQQVERLATQIDCDHAQTTLRPPQSRFDDEEDNPFRGTRDLVL